MGANLNWSFSCQCGFSSSSLLEVLLLARGRRRHWPSRAARASPDVHWQTFACTLRLNTALAAVMNLGLLEPCLEKTRPPPTCCEFLSEGRYVPDFPIPKIFRGWPARALP